MEGIAPCSSTDTMADSALFERDVNNCGQAYAIGGHTHSKLTSLLRYALANVMGSLPG